VRVFFVIDFMNKSDLIKIVSEEVCISQNRAQYAVNGLIDGIVMYVAKGQRVTVPSLGFFCGTSRSARIGRNPKTGANINIDEKKLVKFIPSKNFKEKINRSDE
jgi:nucleoid DNA-binding protein